MEIKTIAQLSIEVPWREDWTPCMDTIKDAVIEYFEHDYFKKDGRAQGDRTAFTASNGVVVLANVLVVEREKINADWLEKQL